MRTWILLRGLTRERRHWGGFEALLRSHVPDDEVIALELPGAGRLRGHTSPTSIPGIVEACRADLHAQGAFPPYVLLALSLGGMVAIDWAARYPGECAAAILVNTSSSASSRWYERLRPRSLRRMLDVALCQDATERERMILELTTRHPSEPAAALVARWAAWRLQDPVSVSNGWRQLLAALRFRTPRTKPAAPILVLASLGDALVNPLCSWRIAIDWSLELRAHPTAGHDLPLDDPRWLAGQAADWIARVVPRIGVPTGPESAAGSAPATIRSASAAADRPC